MTRAITFESVTKQFGSTSALVDVTLSIARRSIVGLIGRNGSGKTTLLHAACGVVLPTAGTVHTLGQPADQLDAATLGRLGVVHQEDSLIAWMTVRQLCRYVAAFHPRWDRALEERMLDALDVSRDQKVGALSPGNRQKLSLVLATSHRPELLLLDEPLSDLDSIARSAVLRMLLDRFSNDEMTIVVSSHLLHDIETVVDHVLCLEGGRLVADEPLDALKERMGVNLEQMFPRLTAGAAHATVA